MIVPEKTPARMHYTVRKALLPPNAFPSAASNTTCGAGVRRCAEGLPAARLDGSSATFQFVVDALRHDWQLIAPDWRGYGETTWLHRPYWFPDYYADLEALLAHYAPEGPVRLVGHSMAPTSPASTLACACSAWRGWRCFDFLASVGPPTSTRRSSSGRWLDAQLAAAGARLRRRAALAARLRVANPRLTPARAEFLCRHLGRVRSDGQVGDRRRSLAQNPSPAVHRIQGRDGVLAARARPVLMLVSAEGCMYDASADEPEELQRTHRLLPRTPASSPCRLRPQ